jgi:predicted nucleotidyltransferase component of viral defense system
MYKVANLSKVQRKELFSETATLMNTTNAIVEKDFWVVWTLSKIFEDERLNKILMFKGGTSLSKVFNLIGRFSEDIDLILDWRLISEENPLNKQDSKNKQVKFNEHIVKCNPKVHQNAVQKCTTY